MIDYVAVGRISGPVGLSGEVKVIPLTDRLQRFELLHAVWIGADAVGFREFVVGGVRFAGSHVVLKLDGISDRTSAERLKNSVVTIPREEAIRPAEGSYFIDDVLGMEVVTEEGKRVGVVREILRLPSNDLWQVESGQRYISIPAVKEFIRNVDVRTRTVVIHEIEGLLDL